MTPEDKKWVEESKEIYGETNPFIKFFSIIEKQERMIERSKRGLREIGGSASDQPQFLTFFERHACAVLSEIEEMEK